MMYGAERLALDLGELGFEVALTSANGNQFVVIPKYEIEIGRFQGRFIDLGIMATADYPRSVASAVHIRANPQLFEKTDSLAKVRNIVDSQLGAEWRYWSHNFQWEGERTTRRLISQINGIFQNA